MVAAESRKVAASTTIAPDEPIVAIRTPATVGPATMAIPSVKLMWAFATTMSFAGTRSTRKACEDASNRDLHPPAMNATIRTCVILVPTPMTTAIGRLARNTNLRTSVSIIDRRRDRRSERAPSRNPNKMTGSSENACRAPTAKGEAVASATSQGTARIVISSPNCDAARPVQ